MLDEQLELFAITHTSTRHTRRLGSLESLRLRPDQAVLLTMVGLIGVAVVFALGVDRGKHLARTERPLEIPHATTSQRTSQPQTSPRAEPSPTAPSPSAPGVLDRKTVPPPRKTPSGPSRVAASRSRFAIQVVSYNRPKLAQQELQRLKERGEPAFLMTTQGRTVLFIGPFPTKEKASARLSSLKRHYQDCFIRSL